VLKGTHFLSVEDVKAKTTEILNSLSENDLQNCFERWQHRMQSIFQHPWAVIELTIIKKPSPPQTKYIH
jgi:hypothetical protein